MTLKRLALTLLTILVVVQLGFSLLASWNAPQITDRLQLYQTDLLLQATELQSEDLPLEENEALRQALLGEEPLKTALEQYQSVHETAEKNLEQFQAQRQELSRATDMSSGSELVPAPTPAPLRQVDLAIQRQQQLIDQLDLRIGIIQTQRDQVQAALDIWHPLAAEPGDAIATNTATRQNQTNLATTAGILLGLWSDPPQLLPDAEPVLQENLEGWFRFRALTRLYELQQRPEALAELQQEEQAIAQQTIIKLALVGTLPLVGALVGASLLIGLLVQRWLKGKQAILAQNSDVTWETPWDGETTWQVLIVGFFFLGQFVMPRLLQLLIALVPGGFALFGSRAEAVSVLVSYVLLAGLSLSVLYFSIKPYFPLPQDWFRFQGKSRWYLWGLGGYLVALPLMILVSLINQQIWQGEGGSNPLLQIVLEERDPISLAIFFFTAAVAAPVFEETLFRGFLLPSLTRYVPVGGAIALSALVFATAHLSLSEVLPLATLGIVLGVVYTRSRDLLAAILLHSLWNSITMIGLFILGSGAK
jgi:hypothetical protein